MKEICVVLVLTSIVVGEAISLGILDKVREKISGSGEEVNSNCLEQDADDYLDRVFGQVQQQLDDPMRLPPRSTFVELSEGRVWGLSTLIRSSPSVVTCFDNDTVIIDGKFSAEQLKGRYLWEKTIAGRKREGFIVIISDDFECKIKIKVPLKTGNGTHPTLEDFSINRLKDIRLEVTGMGFLTWSLSKITTIMSQVFRHALAWALQNPMKEALEREMREMTLS